MKVFVFALSFIFFIVNCQCETLENYKELLHKLNNLEALVVDGYNLFHKTPLTLQKLPTEVTTTGRGIGSSTTSVSSTPNGASTHLPTRDSNSNINNQVVSKLTADIRFLLSRFLQLNIPGHGDLMHFIREISLDTNGLKYLIEGYEEFNELMYILNFYYDLFRAKLHDMCANDYCEIPDHLKISDKELDMLKKVVLGYRKPLENIKDDISKMETFIQKNTQTVENIKGLIEAEEKKRYGEVAVSAHTGSAVAASGTNASASSGQENSSTESETEKYNKAKALYQSIYNALFYKKQLTEAEKLIEVLKKRVQTLKEHKEIKKLLEEIAEKESKVTPPSNTASQTQLQEEINKLKTQIKNIAKTVKFEMEGLFTDPVELDYYLREKDKKASKVVETQSGSTTPPKPTYPNGLIYPLEKENISELLSKAVTETTFGDLQNVEIGKALNKEIFTNDDKRNEFIDKLKNKIKQQEELLSKQKVDYDAKLKLYEEQKKKAIPLFEQFHNGKLDNTLIPSKFEEFKVERDKYMQLKNELKNCPYEMTKNTVDKLNKQLAYLNDYSLRKEVFNKEVKHFTGLEWKLQTEIVKLANEIKKNENILITASTLPLSNVVELQVQKVLVAKKIELLKKVEKLLHKAQLKDHLYVPQVYGTQAKPEAYYLFVLKKEIDKLGEFMPKIKEMLDKEKANPTPATAQGALPVRGVDEILVMGNENEATAVTSPSTSTESSEGATQPAATVQPAAPGVQTGIPVAQPGASAPGVPEAPAPEVPAIEAQAPVQPTQGQVQAATQNGPTMTKLQYLEKLYDFLYTSYVCHKYILVTNSTMNKDLLAKYNLTPEEEEKKKTIKCDQLDLLFNLQNNLPVMYSLFDNMSSTLQSNYIQLYEKEMLYNIYKMKNSDKAIKAFLETQGITGTAPDATPLVNTQATTQAATQVTTQAATQTATQTATHASTHASTQAATQGNVPQASNDEHTPSATTVNPATTTPDKSLEESTSEGTLMTRGNADDDVSEPEEKEIEVEEFYKKYLEEVDKYDDYFKAFLSSKKDAVNKMTEKDWKELEEEVKTLKSRLDMSLDHYNKYKLKLGRLFKKNEKVLSSKEHIKELSILKAQLMRRQFMLNNPRHVIHNFRVFFNKKRETEKKEVENTLKNTDALLKYYKARVKYYNGETFPLKTISEDTLEKENNYLNLEKFKLYSRLEGKLKQNINLEKENITYLSSALYHVLSELKGIIHNKKYTGNPHAANMVEVNNALNLYKDLLPKVETVASTGAATQTQGGEGASAAAAPPAALPAAPPAASAAAPGTANGETATVAHAEDYTEDDNNVIVLPLFGKKGTHAFDQVTQGEAQDKDDNILNEITNEYEVVYVKPLAGVYKTLKKQLEAHVTAFHSNVTNMLESRLKKRNYFLEVLNSDLTQYKHATSDNYVIRDAYKLLDFEKKKKLLSSYKYIKDSVEKDVEIATDGIDYYEKMAALYKTYLESVNAQVDAIDKTGDDATKATNKKFLPFLASINAMYETLLEKVNTYNSQLKSSLNSCQLEKIRVGIVVDKLNDYVMFDEKLEELKSSKEKDLTKLSRDIDTSNIINKLKRSGFVDTDESKKLLSELLDVDSAQLLSMGSKHKCIDITYPDNAGCYRFSDGREEWRCLLNFKKVGETCVPNNNPTCAENNGGCDPTADCAESENNKITCTCTGQNESFFEGVFCGSSSFLSLSFLLAVLLILFNLL
ncbi:merozoite surface protein 1 (MSP1) [Plasmodium ovale curtisi]|uniref:Merozoite surface protein 1 n=1 Tax=Plasmodium ovale curtisi TaxID=864141 RepID=A0A1A8W158_PLAOA|nr:merozoite surface protein 1 (MSP1) [Plasmodium ovale curtisi]